MRRPYNGTYPITREFGVYDPAYANYPGSKHPGTDYGLKDGDPVVASISGVAHIIPRGNTTTGRGNEVWITSGNTVVKYCHLKTISAVGRQQVVAGQQVGECGWTGYVIPKSPAGAHLHFEVLIDGVYVDPETQYNKGEDMNTRERVIAVFKAYLGQDATEAERAYWTGRPNTELDDNAASSRFARDAARIAELEKGYAPVSEQLYRKA